MVTTLYELKIVERGEKPQTNKILKINHYRFLGNCTLNILTQQIKYFKNFKRNASRNHKLTPWNAVYRILY